MNVMNRRGRLRCPITSAAPMAPTPPIANTNPSVRAPPPSSFFTTYGTSTSVGPMNSR